YENRGANRFQSADSAKPAPVAGSYSDVSERSAASLHTRELASWCDFGTGGDFTAVIDSPGFPSISLGGAAGRTARAGGLQALVGRDGSIQDLKLVNGYFALGLAAVDAVKQWRFRPYRLNGEIVEMETYLTVNFPAGPN